MRLNKPYDETPAHKLPEVPDSIRGVLGMALGVTGLSLEDFLDSIFHAEPEPEYAYTAVTPEGDIFVAGNVRSLTVNGLSVKIPSFAKKKRKEPVQIVGTIVFIGNDVEKFKAIITGIGDDGRLDHVRRTHLYAVTKGGLRLLWVGLDKNRVRGLSRDKTLYKVIPTGTLHNEEEAIAFGSMLSEVRALGFKRFSSNNDRNMALLGLNTPSNS